jgi:hypothetical protein
MPSQSLIPPSVKTGEHVVMAIGPSLRQWPSPNDNAYRGTVYKEAREEEKQRLLDVMESHFPGFKIRSSMPRLQRQVPLSISP